MAPDRYTRLRTIMLVVAAVAGAAAGITLHLAGALRGVELNTVDTRFRIRGADRDPPQVAVVEIDQGSLDRLRKRWPIPRALHARAMDRLRAAGARTILYDVVFLEASDRRDDDALRRAISGRRDVVLGTSEVSERGATRLLGRGRKSIDRLGAAIGSTLAPPDPGGVIRRMALEVGAFPTAGVAAAERWLGHALPLPSDQSEWIDYAGPPGTLRTAKFADLLTGRTPPGFFRGRIVVVGPSAPAVGDLHPTSFTQEQFMSGAEAQANAARTALRGFPLRTTPDWVAVLLCIALAAAPALAGAARLRWLAPAAPLVAAALLALGVQVAFDAGRIVPLVAPAAALAVATVASLAAIAVTTALRRQHMRDVFGRFVPVTVIDEALRQTGADLRLGGVEREATVLFSDLRDFTSFAEPLAPERVIAILNRYLESMTDAILDHGGTLISYMGDGIMAVFGAPVEQADHADQGLAAAREMTGERLERFNAWLAKQGIDHVFRMGVGLNTGTVASGNVGSPRRLEYAAIGDTVNTAARLENMTKGSPHQIFVAASTRERLRHHDALTFLGELPVRGRDEPIAVWAEISHP
jgi:adenylate cyclase